MKIAIILILVLLILATTTLADNQTLNEWIGNDTITVLPTITIELTEECNTTSVFSDGQCKPCAKGWIKRNNTKCKFSEECSQGFIYENGFCKQVIAASIKCAPGSHSEKVNNTNITLLDKDGLPIRNLRLNNNSLTCVPDNPKAELKILLNALAIIIGIIFVILCIKRFRKWNNKDHGDGSLTAQSITLKK